MKRFKEKHPTLSLDVICSLFGKSRQAWYKHQSKQEKVSMENAIILVLAKEIRKAQPRIGLRKLYYLLKPQLRSHNINRGRDYLFSLFSEHNMLVARKRRKVKTTYSYSRYRKYPNLIKDMTVCRPEYIWVSDITYIRLQVGFCYLSLVTDIYSHRIVGFSLQQSLNATGCIEALKMAISTRQTNQILIHHSDRGVQYYSNSYINLLGKNKILISMTEQGSPYENAVAERVNGILKDEFSLGGVFDHYRLANQAVSSAIEVYNNFRPHASCDYLTPMEAHKEKGILKKRWKNYYQERKRKASLVSL